MASLKKTGAILIWASTTPVPEGKVEPAWRVADVAIYNEAALRIMKENGIRVDDLYSLALPQLAEIQLPVNVHFTDKGSAALAGQVARVIGEELTKRSAHGH